MARKTGKSKGQRRTPSNRRAGAGTRASARSGAGPKKSVKAGRKTGRRTAGAKTPAGRKRKKAAAGAARRRPVRAATRKTRKAAKPAHRKTAARTRKAGPSTRLHGRSLRAGPSTRLPGRSLRAGPSTKLRAGGTGRESELAQTPETGRSVKGRTNPMPTKRSTGTPAGAGSSRIPGLNRARRQLREVEEGVQTPPSSLDMDRAPSAARSGRRGMQDARLEHNEVGPEITAGDVDADWEDAYAIGDEAPGGDNPTPDQDRVDDIGKALGIEYQDTEELKAADKIIERDRHRWELDPASSEDYKDRDKK